MCVLLNGKLLQRLLSLACLMSVSALANSPILPGQDHNDWLVRQCMDLAIFCDIWSSKQPELIPFGCFQFLPGAACLYVATPILNTCGIDYLVTITI